MILLAAALLAPALADAQAAMRRGGDQVLLLHGGAFTARMLPRLLARYSRIGFRFVGLPEVKPAPAALPAGDGETGRQLDTLCR